MKIIKKALLVCLLFLLSSCNDQLEESKLRKNIAEILTKYQKAVNTLDRNTLEEIISNSFSFYSTDKKSYIDKLLTETVLLDSYTYSNVRVENYKIFCDVTFNGTIIYKPEIQTPIFKELPILEGKTQIHSVFAFVYEKTGLKIFAEDPVLITRTFLWGQASPKIENISLSSYRANPGSLLNISFFFDKQTVNDLAFVYLNKLAIASYAQAGGDEPRELSFQVRVPADFPKGNNYPITITSLAGKNNINDPQSAILQGINIQSFLIPIR